MYELLGEYMTDELIEEIISVLDNYARDIDKLDYGLPTSPWCIQEMVERVRKVINKDE